MDADLLRRVIEGALLAAGKSLSIDRIESLWEEEQRPPRDQIKAALEEIEDACRDRGFELKQTASGYRFQVRQELADWVNKLWEEKPKKYSRATLETLAIIAYRQPMTRGDIEQIRGVTVSSDIIRALQEREWVRVVGHRDVPGRPALYATTRQFLDYFNLKSLEELPPLSELKDIDSLDPELNFGDIKEDEEGDGEGGELLAEHNALEKASGQSEQDGDFEASAYDDADEQGEADVQNNAKAPQPADVNAVDEQEVDPEQNAERDSEYDQSVDAPDYDEQDHDIERDH